MLTEGVTKLIDVWVDGDTTVWHEARPSDAGRQVIVAVGPDGPPRDVIGAPFNVRSAVHEYGGGAAWVEAGVVWFVNWDDQRIWRTPVDGTSDPVALTPEPTVPRSIRYTDMRPSPDGGHLVAVEEVHDPDDTHHVDNRVVLLDATDPSTPVVVDGGHDFVMSPRFVAPDRIRYVAWDHPNMPWNDTALMECSFDPATGTTGPASVVADGSSFMQPVGDVVISDQDGYWNLWRYADGGAAQLTAGDDEVGGPAWVFGLRDHAALPDGRLVWVTGGVLHVGPEDFDAGAASLGQLAVGGGRITAIARWGRSPATIVSFDVDDPSRHSVVVDHPPIPIDAADVSTPERIAYPTGDGATAYGWFYAPVNTAVAPPTDGAPPLIVRIHGGPTGAARPWFTLDYQFWTTRGFAIVDVDHRGSTGYGTAFRNLLDGSWGVVDVEDCIAAATYLAEQGRVDPRHMAISGGSAGGFTVLASLASSDVFAAGASSYGVADLSALASDTHKFESRYLDRLVGPWPEAEEVYAARSPINHLDRFDTPLIVFQGLDDEVVPPNQSEMVVEALRGRGVECEYHAYEGEGHGFRRATTIIDQVNAELAFYRRVFGLT